MISWLAAARTASSVSYTHLDVYKRQLLVSAVLAAAALGFGVWRFLRPAGGALPAMADAVRTTRLEKTTLSERITVTGTVESLSLIHI